MTTSVTVEVRFCSAHRLFNHERHCANVHGHNYLAQVTARAETLDSVGRVIDFSVLRGWLKRWVDDNWDHRLLVSRHDPLVETLMSLPGAVLFRAGNPTAERMAQELTYALTGASLPCEVLSVRLWETPTSYVEVTP